MKKIIQVFLGVGIILYGSGFVFAENIKRAESYSHSDSDAGTVSEPAPYSELLNGSSLNLRLRNAYFKRDYSHPEKSGFPKDPEWSQWAQGVTVDFESGFINDFVGLDASFYTGIKLAGTNPEYAGDELLRKTDNGRKYADSYSRPGRLNAKFHLGNGQDNALFRYGLIGVDTSSLVDSKNRLLESSFRGASVNSVFGSFNDLRLYGVFVDRIATRAGNSNDRFLSKSGKPISNIQVYGTEYTIESEGPQQRSIHLTGEYANSANYVKNYFGQAVYDVQLDESISVTAGLQYKLAEKSGKLWNGYLDGFDRKASQTNTNLKAVVDKLSVAMNWGFNKADNRKSGSVGIDSYRVSNKLASNDHGSGALWTSRQVALFSYDKERVWQLSTGYDLSDVLMSGLNVNLTYTHGSGMNKATGLKREQETDLSLVYEFQQPALKGLSLSLDQAWYSMDKLKETDLVPNIKLSDLRAYANYQVAVF